MSKNYLKKCFTCIKNCELTEKLISMYIIALVALEWRMLGFKLLLCHRAIVLGAFSLKEVGFQIPLYTLHFRVLAFGISRVVTIIIHHRAQSGEHFGTFRNLYYGCGNNLKMMFIDFVFTYFVLTYSGNLNGAGREQRCLSSVNLNNLYILKYY